MKTKSKGQTLESMQLFCGKDFWLDKTSHLKRCWEIVRGIFHYILTFYSTNN